MQQTDLFFPMLAMVLLTIIVMMVLVVRRGADARRRGLSVNQLPPVRQEQVDMGDGPCWSRRTAAAGDQFINLFETPVLFYVVCLAMVSAQTVTALTVLLAWSFVAFRTIHALIHLSYNLVLHRFLAFLMSLIALLAMIVQFILSLL